MSSSAIKDLHYHFGLALTLARDEPQSFYLGPAGLMARLDGIAKGFNRLQGSAGQIETFPRFMCSSPITGSYPSFDHALLHGIKYEIFGFADAQRQIILPGATRAQAALDARYTPFEQTALNELTRLASQPIDKLAHTP